MLYFNFNLHDSSLFLNLITYLSRDWNVSSVALITASLGSLLSLENSILQRGKESFEITIDLYVSRKFNTFL